MSVQEQGCMVQTTHSCPAFANGLHLLCFALHRGLPLLRTTALCLRRGLEGVLGEERLCTRPQR